MVFKLKTDCAESESAPRDSSPPSIRAQLAHRQGKRGLAVFHAEVVRIGGPISKSHLRNIMSGKREASEAVLRYLGYERRVVKVVVVKAEPAPKSKKRMR